MKEVRRVKRKPTPKYLNNAYRNVLFLLSEF